MTVEKMVWGAAGVALICSITTSAALAAGFVNTTGLAAPADVITFDEQVFKSGHIVINAYSADGVIFSPNLVFGLPLVPGTFAPLSGNIVRNFFPNQDTSSFVGTNPFSVKFVDVQTSGAALLNLPVGVTTATALLGGAPVDSVSFTGAGGESRYFGFNGVSFDEIRFNMASATGTILLDNIQLGTASTSIRNTTGLASPVRTITFAEKDLPLGALITNQYADLGVTFSPYVVDGFPIGATTPPLADEVVRNFWPLDDRSTFTGIEPISIRFNEAVTGAAIIVWASNGETEVEARLGGSPVRRFVFEAFEESGGTLQPDLVLNHKYFLGFEGIVFDELILSKFGDNGTVILDTLQIGALAPAPVPVPATAALLAAALGILAPSVLGRRPVAG